MDIEKGEIINDAFDIMKRTFKEINRLKDDVAELLTDYDSRWKFSEEYSSGSGTLIMKHHHSYFFKITLEETEAEDNETPFVPSRGWAEMIRKVYETDPLLCPRCGGQMPACA